MLKKTFQSSLKAARASSGFHQVIQDKPLDMFGRTAQPRVSGKSLQMCVFSGIILQRLRRVWFLASDLCLNNH